MFKHFKYLPPPGSGSRRNGEKYFNRAGVFDHLFNMFG